MLNVFNIGQENVNCKDWQVCKCTQKILTNSVQFGMREKGGPEGRMSLFRAKVSVPISCHVLLFQDLLDLEKIHEFFFFPLYSWKAFPSYTLRFFIVHIVHNDNAAHHDQWETMMDSNPASSCALPISYHIFYKPNTHIFIWRRDFSSLLKTCFGSLIFVL